MTKILFLSSEDENKSCVRWCYPPTFAKNLILRGRVSAAAAQADLHAVQLLEEGEGHAAPDDHLVDLVQHVLDELDLVLDLGAAQDRQERPVSAHSGTPVRTSRAVCRSQYKLNLRVQH